MTSQAAKIAAASRPAQDVDRLPRGNAAQWGVALLSVGLAGAGLSLTSYGELASLTLILFGLNLLLAVMTGLEALRSRLPGKFFLILATSVFFWVEAAGMALKDIPFRSPDGLAYTGAQFDARTVRLTLFYVALLQLLMLAGYAFRPRLTWLTSYAASRFERGSLWHWGLRAFLVGCSWAPYVAAYGGVGGALDALILSRSGGLYSRDIGLFHFVQLFGMFGAALLLAEGLSFQASNRLGRIALGVIAALPFILGGARHLWLFVFLPTVVLVLLRATGTNMLARSIRWGILFLMLVAVIQFQFSLRNVGWDKISTVGIPDLTRGPETGQFVAALYAVQLVPEHHDYFFELAEPYFVTHWIPREFWPDKPIMRSWSYYNETYTQGGIFNVTPSIIGQYHINWGMTGVIVIGLWLGFLAMVADRLLSGVDMERQRAVPVAIGMFYAFIVSSFRFYSPIYITYVVFGVLAMLLVTRYLRLPVEPSTTASHPRMVSATGRR